MRTMTKERKKEGPRLGHKGRADAKASRQLLLLCIPAIIGYILFNYIPMGAAVIILSFVMVRMGASAFFFFILRIRVSISKS